MRFVKSLFFCPIFLLSCGSPLGDSPVGLHYQPKILVDNKRAKSKGSVSLMQIENSDMNATFKSLRSQGKVMFGESKFTSAFNNYNLAARDYASLIGADSIVISLKKAGKAKGDRMLLAARTDATVGYTTSNVLGTASSTLVTPYGSSYGSTNYSGVGLTTNYNPGQTLYTRQEYVYDEYEYVISFFGVPN